MSDPTPQETETALRTKGQRRVNIIWEITQSIIAVLVIASTLFVASIMMLIRGSYIEAFLQLMSNAFFLVIGFYFGRTNHQRVGGPGGETDRR